MKKILRIIKEIGYSTNVTFNSRKDPIFFWGDRKCPLPPNNILCRMKKFHEIKCSYIVMVLEMLWIYIVQNQICKIMIEYYLSDLQFYQSQLNHVKTEILMK